MHKCIIIAIMRLCVMATPHTISTYHHYYFMYATDSGVFKCKVCVWLGKCCDCYSITRICYSCTETHTSIHTNTHTIRKVVVHKFVDFIQHALGIRRPPHRSQRRPSSTSLCVRAKRARNEWTGAIPSLFKCRSLNYTIIDIVERILSKSHRHQQK